MLCSEEHFWWESFFYRIYKIKHLFGLWIKIFRRLSKKVSAGLYKLHFTGLERKFEEENFFESSKLYILIPDFFKKNFWSFFSYLEQCCHLCTPRVKINVSGTWFPYKFHDFVCSSGLWAEKCHSCDKKIQQGCQNFILPVQRINIREQFFYWKKDSFVINFRHCAQLF